MKPEVILHSFGYLTQAAGVTIAVSFAGIAIGFVIGALVCVARLSRRPWLARLGGAYVSVFRGVPLLVQLLFIYYFLAEFGLDVPAIVAAVGGLALSSAAYQAEILRGALNAVPRGQTEAAVALGFTDFEIWRRVLLPQALRISIPPLINEFILLLKASSLVSVVGIAELTRVSMNIASMTYRPLEAYVGGGLFYLAINLTLAASARSRNGGSLPAARDEPRRPLALPAVAGQRLRRDHLLLERGRRARHGARVRDRAARPAAVSAAALGAARLRRGLPRHAVSHAALPALCRRPLSSG